MELRPLFLILFPLTLAAQGVHFEEGLSWTAAQAKARAENKYLFVDCYTTWCGPCKFMSRTIFPQKEVGDFFNDKFVCISVQLDTTSRDNAETRSWYADAHALVQEYHVYAYPTFLIFAPDGRPLHRIVGARNSAPPFLKLVGDAFDTDKQYYPKVREFRDGRRDPNFLFGLAVYAHNLHDDEIGRESMRTYFQVTNDTFSHRGIELIYKYTERTTDSGFAFIVANAARIDTVMGTGTAEQQITRLIDQELTRPIIAGAGAFEPDWKAVRKNVATRFPDWAEEVTERARLDYYQHTHDWRKFRKMVSSYMEKYGTHASAVELNDYARMIFESCPDLTCVTGALDWAHRAMELSPHAPFFMDTYANLLYKLGKKDEAVIWEQKAIDAAAVKAKYQYEDRLALMQKGEKTWN